MSVVKRLGFLLSSIRAGAISLVLCNAYMADETTSATITSNWQAYKEDGVQIKCFEVKMEKQRVGKYLLIASERSQDLTPLNNYFQETLFQTEYLPAKISPSSQSLPHMDAVSFCCTSWKWVLVVRGEWKHTFWAWVGSSWKEFTKLAQGQSSWLCWYDSLTGQHTPEPNSPWKHYGSHNGKPSVIYLHVFKCIAHAHAHALDIHFELQR